MKNFILVLALSMIAATGCNDQVKEPTEPPVVTVPVPTVNPPPTGTDVRPAYPKGPIKTYQIAHFSKSGNPKKYMKKTDILQVELEELVRPWGKEIAARANELGVPIDCYISASTTHSGSSYHHHAEKDFPKSAVLKTMKYFKDEKWGNICDKALQAHLRVLMKECRALGARSVNIDNVGLRWNESESGICSADPKLCAKEDGELRMKTEENARCQNELAVISHEEGLHATQKNAGEMAHLTAKFHDGIMMEDAGASDNKWSLLNPFQGKPVYVKSSTCKTSPSWIACQSGGDYFEDY